MFKQTRYFLRSMVHNVPKNDPPRCSTTATATPDPRPIDVFILPESVDYDSLVDRAEREQEESETSIAEDLGTSTHTVTEATPPTTLPLETRAMPGHQHLSHRHWKRHLKRKAEDASQEDNYIPSQRTLEKAIKTAKTIDLADIDAANFDAAKGAHTGKRGTQKTYGTKAEKEKEYTLQELIGLGYFHIPWDGIHPLLIVDCKGRIITILAGRPDRDDFTRDILGLFDAMMSVSRERKWEEDMDEVHKRGWFHAFNRGVTMGMGSPVPVQLSNGEEIDAVLTRLLSLPGFQRLNGYHNSVVKLWAPRLHATYRDTVEKMYKKLEGLSRNFPRSIFTAAAFNFGGQVRTIQHRDHMNWPFGLCVITAMGRFDAKRSGHLVLKEFKLVIDFPHAATAAIPSACITHFNTAIHPDDTRTSFTQYTAGAIFRWVENGFRTERAIKESDFVEWQTIQDRKDTVVAERLKLYSKVDEILVHVE
ncbi:hypothetical protein VNI00_007622 [Paramarasmius palmivorus]|uniref:Uncharacterized protein n=1 Tax=Paramarasmius palmivorus TaxID=297713 RepID=A0AAW0D1X2_9AGAR